MSRLCWTLVCSALMLNQVLAAANNSSNTSASSDAQTLAQLLPSPSYALGLGFERGWGLDASKDPCGSATCCDMHVAEVLDNLGSTLPLPECAWQGVCCSGWSVVGLDLSCRRCHTPLSGALPAALADLRYLQLLNVSNNSYTTWHPFSDSLLNSYTTLAFLRVLDVSKNQLAEQLPSVLGRLWSLEVANFSNNNVPGELPTAWDSMHRLQELRLAANSLSGSIPLGWGFSFGMYSLRLIDVRDNCGVCSVSPFMSIVQVLYDGTSLGETCSIFNCSQQLVSHLLVALAMVISGVLLAIGIKLILRRWRVCGLGGDPRVYPDAPYPGRVRRSVWDDDEFMESLGVEGVGRRRERKPPPPLYVVVVEVGEGLPLVTWDTPVLLQDTASDGQQQEHEQAGAQGLGSGRSGGMAAAAAAAAVAAPPVWGLVHPLRASPSHASLGGNGAQGQALPGAVGDTEAHAHVYVGGGISSGPPAAHAAASHPLAPIRQQSRGGAASNEAAATASGIGEAGEGGDHGGCGPWLVPCSLPPLPFSAVVLDPCGDVVQLALSAEQAEQLQQKQHQQTLEQQRQQQQPTEQGAGEHEDEAEAEEQARQQQAARGQQQQQQGRQQQQQVAVEGNSVRQSFLTLLFNAGRNSHRIAPASTADEPRGVSSTAGSVASRGGAGSSNRLDAGATNEVSASQQAPPPQQQPQQQHDAEASVLGADGFCTSSSGGLRQYSLLRSGRGSSGITQPGLGEITPVHDEQVVQMAPLPRR